MPSNITYSYLILGGAVLWFVAFLVIPLLMLVVSSFMSFENYSIVYELTISQYQNVMNMTFFNAMVLTFLYGVAVVAISLLIGYPLAYYLRFHLSFTQSLFVFLLLLIPFFTMEVVRMYSVFSVLGKLGVVNKLLLEIGLIDAPLALMFTRISVAWGYLLNYSIFMTGPIFISLTQVEDEHIDTAKIFCGTPVSIFRSVIWPMSLPGVTIGTFLVFLLTIGNFLVPRLLSSGKGQITSYLFTLVNQGVNYPAASAVSVFLMIPVLVLIVVLNHLVDITEPFNSGRS
ncbi:ABC transporter permease [Salinigranum marinum]|uniref:ABC transporter permease n=1 Tax=Salinigranum marinum TaxID=1515595 RepID=UPI002989DBA8|nr:ABC transporter permease [Salinigranum marinum]